MHPDAHPSLIALRDLRERLRDALADGYPPNGPELAEQLIEIHELSLWCRDAGLAWMRTGCTWDEISRQTGLPIQTLQSRWTTWYRREAGR